MLNHTTEDELIYVVSFSKETLQAAQRTFTGAVIDVYQGAESKLDVHVKVGWEELHHGHSIQGMTSLK